MTLYSRYSSQISNLIMYFHILKVSFTLGLINPEDVVLAK